MFVYICLPYYASDDGTRLGRCFVYGGGAGGGVEWWGRGRNTPLLGNGSCVWLLFVKQGIMMMA